MECFVIMPFAAEFDDVYAHIKMAVEGAVTGDKIACYRLDDVTGPGKISDDLIKSLNQATFCIADLTGSNANVMWELGYATAQNKPVVSISQDTKNLPFDIRDMRTVQYDRNSLAKTLGDKLNKAILAVLGKHSVPRTLTQAETSKPKGLSIAVTGSMRTDKFKCEKRIPQILDHYLSKEIHWFCGSYGDVDECVIKYLLANEQNVTAVGYHAYDVSNEILDLVQKRLVSFVDSTTLQVIKGIKAPSKRDLFFLTKCDLQIVFWSNKSVGTKKIIDLLLEHERDCITAFI